MALVISHSSLRVVPANIISRRSKATFHDHNRSTTKNFKSAIFPTKCPTHKFILHVRKRNLYGESRFSKCLLFGRYMHNSFRACAQVESDDSNIPVFTDAQFKSASPNSAFDKVLRFGSASYKFTRPYAQHEAIISTICIFARVLVENPQVFKWSVLFKAFPGLIAVMLAYAYYNGINQIYDVDIDRLNKPYLPIPAGELSLQQAWFLMIFDVLVGLLILRLMNADLITTSLYCLGLILGTFYSTPPFRFKESSVATVIVIPLITGIIQNIGVFYAATASLGLPFWSPSIVFITTFVTVFFVPISLIKDLTDVEGDLKHNIWTFTVTYGHKNIVAVSTGILLLNYIGAIAAAIYMPQAFKLNLMLPAHSLPATWLLIQAMKLHKANYCKEACADFFQFLWKLLGLEFLLFPFM